MKSNDIQIRSDVREAMQKAIRENDNEAFYNSFEQMLLCIDVYKRQVHTFSEAKKIRDRYIRRLKYDYPDAVIFAYLGRGKSTHRIHMHMLVDGVPPEVIRKKWGQGSVLRVDRLREHNYYNGIDHGQDYTGLANYLFDHWTPEQGGHRWKQTKNARRPDIENAKPVRRAYSESRPPAAPKGRCV